MSIRAAVRYQTDIIVNEEEGGLDLALRKLRRQSAVVLRELKRRRNAPKPGVRRRNKRWFSPQTKSCVLMSGEYWTIRSRSYRPPPFEPE